LKNLLKKYNINMNKYVIESFEEYVNGLKINEGSFYDVKDSDILTDKFIKEFINNNYSGYLSYYIEENDLDENDENEIQDSVEYYEYVKDILERGLEEAKDNIYYKINDESGKIKLYRAMDVDENWMEHLKTKGKHLGIYWSWDEDGAVAHWSKGKKLDVIMETEIDEKYINWQETLTMNMHPSYSEEKEIRLFKNTPININRISINGKDVDISEIKNKTFYA